MNLHKANILIASGFAATYGGNFIAMLKVLAAKLKSDYQCNIIFVFPQQKPKPWLDNLNVEYIVRYTQNRFKKTAKELQEIISEFNIDLIYTHFDVYDIPVAKAIKRSKRDIKFVLHLHNYLTLETKKLPYTFLRKLKRHFFYWLKYGYWCKNAFYIGVSSEVTYFASHYRTHIFSFPKKGTSSYLAVTNYPNAEVVINGIDISRINKLDYESNNKNHIRFLSFGGDAFTKGISTILKAAEYIETQDLSFELYITNGYKVPELLDKYYGNNKWPNWLKVLDETENISHLFNICDVYISASYYETMSMAIAEASIFGLPIIQSDIPGTMWNTDIPSSFLFKVGDASDLASQMIKIIKIDKAFLKEQCKVSSQINKKRLDINVWCNSIISIYKKL